MIAIPQRVPLVGAEARKSFVRREVLGRRRKRAGLEFAQELLTAADHALEQQDRQDGELVAHHLGGTQFDWRALSAAHDVEEAWPLDQSGNCLDLVDALRRLHEGHLRAGRERGIGALDGLLEVYDCSRIGACDDQEIGTTPCIHGRPDFCDVVVERNDLLVVQVSALLREDLILDVDGRNTPPFEFAHGADHIEFIAVSCVGIGDNGDVDRAGDPSCVFDHFAHGQQPIVGIAMARRGAGAGHVNGRKSRTRDQCCRDAVVCTRRDGHAVLPQQASQLLGFAHADLQQAALLRPRTN